MTAARPAGTLVPTRVWFLEMASPADLRPARDPGSGAAVVRAEEPLGALNRFFYTECGRDHHWVDRLGWSRAEWAAYAEQPALETWLAWWRGTPAGYAELESRPDGAGRIAFLGVLPAFQGRGLGGHLLTRVVRRAWERSARRVIVDTCEIDGPQALPGYRRRGFRVVGEAVEPRGRQARG